MSEPATPEPLFRLRALLLPVALGTFVGWLAVGSVVGVGCATGLLRCSGSGGRVSGFPVFLNIFVVGAGLGVFAAVIGCLGLPFGLWFYRWRQRASAAAAKGDSAG